LMVSETDLRINRNHDFRKQRGRCAMKLS